MQGATDQLQIKIVWFESTWGGLTRHKTGWHTWYMYHICPSHTTMCCYRKIHKVQTPKQFDCVQISYQNERSRISPVYLYFQNNIPKCKTRQSNSQPDQRSNILEQLMTWHASNSWFVRIIVHVQDKVHVLYVFKVRLNWCTYILKTVCIQQKPDFLKNLVW